MNLLKNFVIVLNRQEILSDILAVICCGILFVFLPTVAAIIVFVYFFFYRMRS